MRAFTDLFHGPVAFVLRCSMPCVKPRMATFLQGQWETVLGQGLPLTPAPRGCYFTTNQAASTPLPGQAWQTLSPWNLP